MYSEVASQIDRILHCLSDVCVDPAVSYSVPVQSEISVQLLSEVAVATADSKCLNGSHTVSFVHWRLDVVVGATDSNCQTELQAIIFLHSGAVSAL